jgi:hypothetical protein
MEAEGNIAHVPVITVTANAKSDQISGVTEAGMVGLFFCSHSISSLDVLVPGLA